MGGAGVQTTHGPDAPNVYMLVALFNPQPLGVITYNLRFHDSGVQRSLHETVNKTCPHFDGEMAGLKSFHVGHAKGRPD